MQDVEWMASHRALQAEADDKQRRDHFGNELADTAAKEARSRHPQTESEGVEETSYYMKRAKWVAQAIAIAMAMFPPKGERLRRTQYGIPLASNVKAKRHAWLFTDGAWRCCRCGTWKAGGEQAEPDTKQTCKEWGGKGALAKIVRMGHRVSRAEGDHVVTFCVRCGACATRRARKLTQKFGVPTAAGKQALKRIADGWMPWQLRKGRKDWFSRGRVRCVSAFDPRCFEWQVRHVEKGKITIASSRPRIEAGQVAGEEREEREAERAGIDEAIGTQAHFESDNAMDYDTFDADYDAAEAMGNACTLDAYDGGSSTTGGIRHRRVGRSYQDGEADRQEKPEESQTQCGSKRKRGKDSPGVEALACKPRVAAFDKNRTEVDESLHHAESQVVRSRQGITAATKAKKELSMFEARAIQDLSARLTPTASRAQERYLALKQRVIDRGDREEKREAQMASVEGEPHRSRLRVKVMPSDGRCVYHALESGLRQRSRRQDEGHVDYRRLRWRISSYMLDRPDEELGGTSIRSYRNRGGSAAIRAPNRRLQKSGTRHRTGRRSAQAGPRHSR